MYVLSFLDANQFKWEQTAEIIQGSLLYNWATGTITIQKAGFYYVYCQVTTTLYKPFRIQECIKINFKSLSNLLCIVQILYFTDFIVYIVRPRKHECEFPVTWWILLLLTKRFSLLHYIIDVKSANFLFIR